MIIKFILKLNIIKKSRKTIICSLRKNFEKKRNKEKRKRHSVHLKI